jgi:putative component of membrane protein insertase Oxa1/YidC/SpoIIIJ protein YidD
MQTHRVQKWMVDAIDFYQRRLSPHKGFCCTYRIVFGVPSCSQQAKNYLHAHGPWRSLWFTVKRLSRCLVVRCWVGMLYLRTRDIATCHRYIRWRVKTPEVVE